MVLWHLEAKIEIYVTFKITRETFNSIKLQLWPKSATVLPNYNLPFPKTSGGCKEHSNIKDCFIITLWGSKITICLMQGLDFQHYLLFVTVWSPLTPEVIQSNFGMHLLKADSLPKRMSGSLLLWDAGFMRYRYLHFPNPYFFRCWNLPAGVKKIVPGEVLQSDPTCQSHFSGVLHPRKHDLSAKKIIAGVSHQSWIYGPWSPDYCLHRFLLFSLLSSPLPSSLPPTLIPCPCRPHPFLLLFLL